MAHLFNPNATMISRNLSQILSLKAETKKVAG